RMSAAMEQYALEFAPQRRVYTVSELNAAIRGILDAEFQDVWVAGEISGTKLASSGHYYFTLKERDAQVRCVCFRSTHRYLKFKPQDGVAVVARGRIDVFEARGEYQLIVEFLEPQGHGALQFAFEQLKKKLASEGLFEPARKRPLPRFPRRIGIVTSPRGAVISDMLQILERRFPGLHIRVFPALVQGEGAVEEVCRGLEFFGQSRWPELVILARGGGSLEDLWTFNEEQVARAIAACPVPVVSAIGHETDVTIADFVADLRAPTPSAAAELIVSTRDELLARIVNFRRHLEQAERYRLAMLRQELDQQGIQRTMSVFHRLVGRRMQRVDEQEYRLREHVRSVIEAGNRTHRLLESRLRYYDPRPRFARDRRRLERAQASIAQALQLDLARRSNRAQALAAKLSQLSPLRILDRGYAIVTNDFGEIVKASQQAPVDSAINVRLAKGSLGAKVTRS
ncbi:MAG TPA: exodeoxyribonuclease VII large subunit, partial [Bryobacteraceae bacterium]|nr:exodeoxyribonuclease VII large subunit [Bryobacteraceae bacterium]